MCYYNIKKQPSQGWFLLDLVYIIIIAQQVVKSIFFLGIFCINFNRGRSGSFPQFILDPFLAFPLSFSFY